MRGSVRECGGVVSHPPIRPPARGGDHDRVFRGPGCSVRSSTAAGRLRLFCELTRGQATPPGGGHRAAVGGAARCGAAACPASVSRCQARAARLRAMTALAAQCP